MTVAKTKEWNFTSNCKRIKSKWGRYESGYSALQSTMARAYSSLEGEEASSLQKTLEEMFAVGEVSKSMQS